jgi:SPP1 family predicted phage head-tail adaptor
MRPVQVGKFRQRVTLQGLQETIDTYGQPVQSWVDLVTIWAEVRPLRGAEILNIKQTWATASHFVNHRFLGILRPNPKQRYQIQKDFRILNILNVNNVEERNHAYEVICEEYVP